MTHKTLLCALLVICSLALHSLASALPNDKSDSVARGDPEAQVEPPRYVTPVPASSVVDVPQHCFGALGNQCGQSSFNTPVPGLGVSIPMSALCAAGHCFINAGSWEHDECCFGNPRGMMCSLNPVDHDGTCVNAWYKALDRLTGGFTWSRDESFSRTNTTGHVELALYCAQAGDVVNVTDRNRCCSGRMREGNFADFLFLRVRADQLGSARICE